MTDPRKDLFERAAQMHREMDAIRADLAALKVEFVGADNGMDKDEITDLMAAAKIHVADPAKREKAEARRAKRQEMADEMGSGIPTAKPETVARVAQEKRQVAAIKVVKAAPETPPAAGVLACTDCGEFVSSLCFGRCPGCDAEAKARGPLRWDGPERVTDLDRVRA